MDNVKRVIFSEERNIGRIIQIISFVFFAFISINTAAMIYNNEGVGLLFILFPFYFFILLIYVIGRFQKKKYERLGATPLTLTPSFCTIGNPTSGSILIKRENFNKVNQLFLTCWKKTSGSESSEYYEIWKTSIEPHLKFADKETTLDFEFLIPEGKKATTKSFSSTKKYYWEISFEFVESMDSIKRTWKIPVF